ncbi:fumarylacetoacetate hydrolase family protein [Achromobacter xylosoxidans]|uniref:fumarylacetoacetate hydrolase family protein n=1 Tax=Alcaligenes xylosoxydans xylosoxydans TaxID=85698 RepID=UPI000B491238|nr:fumarylacetoacetate hydrolase family protein [Achromobacter xylosoxidans]
MKLASFWAAGRDRIGFEDADGNVVDIAAAATSQGMPQLADVRADLLALLETEHGSWWPALRDLHRLYGSGQRATLKFSPGDIAWHPPVRRPSKLCCLALNNSANSERILSGPKHPAVFVKPWTAMTGNHTALQIRPVYGRVHPEPELAVVIGVRAKDVSAAEAMNHVFGYTIHNDFTSPTMRAEDTFHYRAIHPSAGDPEQIEYVDTHVSYPGRYKCSDTFSAVGPWLVTADDIEDPHALDVSCSHDGRLITQDNTANLFFKLPEVIEFLSSYMTLMPGDIISLGTALRRSGGGMAVQNVNLAELGGVVSVAISGLGTLSNHVARMP